jgi:O-methyltransferase
MTAESSAHSVWVAEAEHYLAAARKPTALGPGPEAETLRRAYLDLLKLCLCDLTGTSTVSVGAQPDGVVTSRELRDEGLRLRAAGMDWPLTGLTMVGLGRLDDLQTCVEAIVADDVPGDVIEAGAWRGGASILARATLDGLGDDRAVWVADSFEGFPEVDDADSEAFRLSALDFLAAPLEEVRESFARLGCDRGVEFVPGFFQDTLPGLAGRRWSLIRLDADTYEPTRLALDRLYPGLSVGGYMVVDDYFAFQGCRQAIDQFRSENGITEPLERIDFAGVRWRRESEHSVQAPLPDHARPRTTHPRPPATRDAQVRTERELELERELAALTARLAAHDAEVGLRPWLRRKLGRGSR